MIDALDIRRDLIDRLEPIFGKPKNADGLAAELARHAPGHADLADLARLSDRIIEGRKAKGFPSAAELIGLVKAIQPRGADGQARGAQHGGADDARRRDEAEARALGLLDGTDIARRAVEGGWAPGLIDFATEHGRVPDAAEEGGIVRRARANEALARENQHILGGALLTLRRLMLWRAARDLGFTVEEPALPTFEGRRMRIRPQPPYAPGAEPGQISAADLAPSPELLATLGMSAESEEAV